MPSLLVTNDFPPKVGGIQSYLWELWRRLPPGEVTVLTTAYSGAAAFDAAQPFRIERAGRVLLPTPGLARRIDALAGEVQADVVFLDPALPLGALGPRLRSAPYVVVLHGAEVAVPGRLPGSHRMLARVLHGAVGVVAAGTYPAREAARAAGRGLPTLVVPPGVDVARFHPPAGEAERDATRRRLGLPEDAPLVLGVSRLVPRKGFDVLIAATARLNHGGTPGPGGAGVHLALAGAGRDRDRLRRRAAAAGLGGRFHLLGRVSDADIAGLYGAADVFAMICRERWGGLEAEGFGIVFLEAAACATPSVAGRSGGAEDAVVDGVTGFVVAPRDAGAVAAALDAVLSDPDLRKRLGAAARARAEAEFAYDALAARLAPLAAGDVSVLTPPAPAR
ncbi:MAG TPA: glycosyltransferase family 4 protein [Acidimicrobiia bacterium]|jgi:phosphatidylinositol alpha-1,6-mannosyltransferase